MRPHDGNKKAAKFISFSLKEIVVILFPHYQNNRRLTVVQLNEYLMLPVTKEELGELCGRISDNKATGFEGASNRALKLIDFFTNTFEASLKEGIFPQ